LVIWFAAAFAEAIREREEHSDVHMAVLAGSVLVGGTIFVPAAALQPWRTASTGAMRR
jgi:hypothetical protein